MIRPVVRSSVLGAVLLAWFLPALAACGGDGDGSTTPPHAGHEACAAGEITRDDGTCQPAGAPEDPCGPGTIALDGACQAAGIDPAACADGFLADAESACAAVLPADACPAGRIAVPGDTSCREVAPCDGTWGSAPLDATTEYVDAAYVGTDSDGTSAHPWTTIQAGIDAAAGSGVVAVAAATYAEDLVVSGKAVRLWGRCPSLVHVGGAGGTVAISIGKGATGTEVHDLGITGGATGVLVAGAEAVVIERAWLHDLGGAGIGAFDAKGPTSVEVRGSLIEAAVGGGVLVGGAIVTVEESVVRDTSEGYGFEVHDTAAPGLTVRRSVIERNAEFGVAVTASDVTLDGVVVRDTKPSAAGHFGRGVDVMHDQDTGARAHLVLARSVIERNHDTGVQIAGSDASISATVVRDTSARGDGLFGEGIAIQYGAVVDIAGSVVARSREGGVVTSGSTLTLTSSIVTDTALNEQGHLGGGIGARADSKTGARATLTVRGSVVERSHNVGIFVSASDAVLEQTVVRGTEPNGAGLYGRGILVQIDTETGARASASVTGCLIEDNHEVGIAVGASDATLSQNLVRNTLANGEGKLGDGITIVSEAGPASATIVGTRVESSARAALSSFGASVTFGANVFDCNGFDLEGEEFGGAGFAFDHTGGNLCGCAGEAAASLGECQVMSAGLEPPTLGGSP